MDGYALRLADLRRAGDSQFIGRSPDTLVTLRVAGEVPIGFSPPPLPHGACLRIVTGGAIPAGADAVLRRELVREIPGADANAVASIEIQGEVIRSLREGEHIRRAGENAPAGSIVAPAGRVIDAAIVGAIAAFGLARVRLRRAIRVAILTTGDELVPIDAPAEPWQIRESNGTVLEALLAGARWIASIDRRHAPDDLETITRAVRDALGPTDSATHRPGGADALIITGGVSMGHRDFVPEALARCGVRTLFHRLPQRPGRPILGGVTSDGRPVLALPGNPVSVMVTARRIVWPVLAHRAGAAPTDAVACASVSNDDGRRIDLWWHRPVRLVGDGVAELLDTRGSGDIVAAAASDGFVEIPPREGGAGPWPFRAWRA